VRIVDINPAFFNGPLSVCPLAIEKSSIIALTLLSPSETNSLARSQFELSVCKSKSRQKKSAF